MRKYIFVLFMVFINIRFATAGEFNIPNTFTAGTSAKASEVNENYRAAKEAIDDNSNRINTNISDISEHDGRISSNEEDLSVLDGVITVGAGGTTISVDGIELLRLSRELSTHSAHPGIYERKVELLRPAGGEQELGKFVAYGQVRVIGSSRNSEVNGVGPALVLDSKFKNNINNRHFYIHLGDTWNVPGVSKGDVVFHSWDNNFRNQVQHMIFKSNGNVGIGTISPNSSLEIGGYIQLSTTAGNVPPGADCTQRNDYGRMKVDEINSLIYICTAAGWVGK